MEEMQLWEGYVEMSGDCIRLGAGTSVWAHLKATQAELIAAKKFLRTLESKAAGLEESLWLKLIGRLLQLRTPNFLRMLLGRIGPSLIVSHLSKPRWTGGRWQTSISPGCTNT